MVGRGSYLKERAFKHLMADILPTLGDSDLESLWVGCSIPEPGKAAYDSPPRVCPITALVEEMLRQGKDKAEPSVGNPMSTSLGLHPSLSHDMGSLVWVFDLVLLVSMNGREVRAFDLDVAFARLIRRQPTARQLSQALAHIGLAFTAVIYFEDFLRLYYESDPLYSLHTCLEELVQVALSHQKLYRLLSIYQTPGTGHSNKMRFASFEAYMSCAGGAYTQRSMERMYLVFGSGSLDAHVSSPAFIYSMADRSKGAVTSLIWTKYHDLCRLFGIFDLDGGGSVDYTEMKVVLNSLAQHPTEEEISEVMETGDVGGEGGEGDGELDFVEFVSVLVQRSRGASLLLKQIHEFREAYSVFQPHLQGGATAHHGADLVPLGWLNWESLEWGMVRLGLKPRFGEAVEMLGNRERNTETCGEAMGGAGGEPVEAVGFVQFVDRLLYDYRWVGVREAMVESLSWFSFIAGEEDSSTHYGTEYKPTSVPRGELRKFLDKAVCPDSVCYEAILTAFGLKHGAPLGFAAFVDILRGPPTSQVALRAQRHLNEKMMECLAVYRELDERNRGYFMAEDLERCIAAAAAVGSGSGGPLSTPHRDSSNPARLKPERPGHLGPGEGGGAPLDLPPLRHPTHGTLFQTAIEALHTLLETKKKAKKGTPSLPLPTGHKADHTTTGALSVGGEGGTKAPAPRLPPPSSSSSSSGGAPPLGLVELLSLPRASWGEAGEGLLLESFTAFWDGFRGFGRDALLDLASKASTVKLYSPGELIAREGEAAEESYLVMEGSILSIVGHRAKHEVLHRHPLTPYLLH